MKKVFMILLLASLSPLALAQTVSPAAVVPPKDVFSKTWWADFYCAGYDYSMLGDVLNGMKTWDNILQSGGRNPTTSNNNVGSGYGVELGYSLDPDNAISLSVEDIGTQDDTYSYTQAGYTFSQSISPSLQSVSLNYYRTLIKTGGTRTYAVIGGGLYNASVSFYNGGGSPVNVTTATLEGQTLGGTLGLNEEIGLMKDIILGISVKGRLATISQVTTNSIAYNGVNDSGHAPYALMIDQTLVPGTI